MEEHSSDKVGVAVTKGETSSDDEEEEGPVEQRPEQRPEAENHTSNNTSGSRWRRCTQWWSLTVQAGHKPIMMGLQFLTGVSARNPKSTIAIATALSVLLMIVGLLTNFTIDVDENSLWTPTNAYSVKHNDWIQQESGFPKAPRYILLLFHNNGQNVLGKQPVEHIFETLETMYNVSGFDTICPLSTNNTKICDLLGVPLFWNMSKQIFESTVSNDEDAIRAMSSLTFPSGQPVIDDSLFGYPQRDPNTTLLTSVLGYSLIVQVPDTSDAIEWELDVVDAVLDLNSQWNNEFRVEISADSSFSEEFTRAIITDIPLVPLVFLIMSLFTFTIFSNFKNRVTSRSLLGFSAVVAVLLSMMTGYGILFISGIPFTSVTQILPFIIFGVGLDDVYILMGSYMRTDHTKNPEERIADAIDDIGISITLTTATSTAAFALGCITTIPAVYWLCLYAAPTILLVLLYQLTFFVACIVLDERRIISRRLDCCFCIKSRDEIPEPEMNDDPEAHFAERFMIGYTRVLLNPFVKVFVTVSFVALFALCCWSASQLTQAFSFTEVLPKDSFLTEYMEAFEKFSTRNELFTIGIYFRDVDQSNPDIQKQMEKYVTDLVAMESIKEQPDFFWLRDFHEYVNQTKGADDLPFFLQVELFLSEPVFFDLYHDDVIRDDFGSIVTSRTYAIMNNVDYKKVNQQIDALKEQLDVTKAQPINQESDDFSFFTFDKFYNVWEFLSVINRALVVNTILGISVVTFIAFIMIPHWSAAVFIFPLICVLYVDLLGALQWAGVHINAVSYVTLVMSIGLIVDFIMHVMLRYYECPGNRHEKTKEMMRTMGSSIFLGGLSTFLGTMPLAFSTSTAFRTVFVCFLGLVTISVGHGLILMPVLLSTIGPNDTISLSKASRGNAFRQSVTVDI